jgi:hypothetical protein
MSNNTIPEDRVLVVRLFDPDSDFQAAERDGNTR